MCAHAYTCMHTHHVCSVKPTERNAPTQLFRTPIRKSSVFFVVGFQYRLTQQCACERVCMYVFMYICIYIHICICVYMVIYTQIDAYTHVCSYMCVCMRACMSRIVSAYACMQVWMPLYQYACIIYTCYAFLQKITCIFQCMPTVYVWCVFMFTWNVGAEMWADEARGVYQHTAYIHTHTEHVNIEG